MKKLLLIGAAFTALTGPAMAAEQRVPAPAYVPPAYAPPVSDWTGFYVGDHGGYG